MPRCGVLAHMSAGWTCWQGLLPCCCRYSGLSNFGSFTWIPATDTASGKFPCQPVLGRTQGAGQCAAWALRDPYGVAFHSVHVGCCCSALRCCCCVELPQVTLVFIRAEGYPPSTGVLWPLLPRCCCCSAWYTRHWLDVLAVQSFPGVVSLYSTVLYYMAC